MAMNYVRWGGFRVRHQGADTGKGRIVDVGWLCGAVDNDTTDRRVQIYHVHGLGYTYKVLP